MILKTFKYSPHAQLFMTFFNFLISQCRIRFRAIDWDPNLVEQFGSSQIRIRKNAGNALLCLVFTKKRSLKEASRF